MGIENGGRRKALRHQMPPRYQEMFGRLDDTIVAICSPVGVSVRGIVRLSGPDAFPLAEGVFADRQGRPLAQAPGHRRILGRVWINASGTVPAEAYTFRAPASYTRQDVVELHLIGSPPVLAMVLEQLTNKGARPAEPGEFTARAYFSGAMDLTRVEGVAAIVYARRDAQLRASEALLHGRLSKRSTELRERLADLLALIEAEIDFAEEPIDFISRSQAIAVIDKATVELASLLRDSPSVERLEVLPEVMLVGPANAGKSTLFNRLTGMDRAIQSATAGTTRDVLRAPAPVAGGEVMLLDAAGLASAGEGPAALRDSHLAELAEKAARRAVACADLILLVLDGTNRPEQAAAALRPTLPARPTCTVVNKIDRLPPERLSALLDQIDPAGAVSAVSALTREGVELLRARIGRMLFDQAHSHGAEVLALANWQRTALRTACENLARAR